MTQDLSVYTAESYNLERLLENRFPAAGLFRPDQLAAVCYLYGWPFWGTEAERETRDPGLIISIGAGVGRLERWLEDRGHQVIGVDPSPGAQQLYEGTTLLPEYPGGGNTILFVESIEHLPVELTLSLFERFPSGARVIVVNWPDYHPLELEPPYHITRIDDKFYAALAKRFARSVLLHRGSHFVMEIR